MKKFLLTVSLILAAALPSFALKEINPYQWGKHEKVEVLKVYDSMEVRVELNRMRAPVYVSNLDCHEYSQTYPLKSSRGYTYIRPKSTTERLNTKVTQYVQSVFEKYPDNIYFVPNGYGLYSNLVGEFYIGKVSLSRHLIEKGLCSRVE